MLKIYNFNNEKRFKTPIYILGSFESFHIGHNLLYSKAHKVAKEIDGEIVLVFFKDIENLPKINNKILTDYSNRIQMFANMGFENCIELIYSEICKINYLDFINVLTEKYLNFHFIVGSDFRFGYKGEGNATKLKDLFGDKVSIIEPLMLNDNSKVSTSFIKESITFGDIDVANDLMLFNYSYNCKLETNKNNIHKVIKDEKLINPNTGIYAILIEINEYIYYGVLMHNIKNEIWLKFIDFTLKSEQTIDIKIKYLNKLRNFMNNEQENINLNDEIKAKNYFLNN